MAEMFSAAGRRPRAARVNIEQVNDEDESIPALNENSFETPEDFFESLKEKLRENIIDESDDMNE